MFENDPVTTQYYRRYDDGTSQHADAAVPQYASNPVTTEETLHIYRNTALTPQVRKGSNDSFTYCTTQRGSHDDQ